MASTPEGKVKEKIKKLLKLKNVYYFMPRGTTYGRSGVPDFIACVSGSFLGIEAKAGRNTPSPLQDLELANIKNAGGYAIVVNENNLDELETLLDRLSDENYQ